MNRFSFFFSHCNYVREQLIFLIREELVFGQLIFTGAADIASS